MWLENNILYVAAGPEGLLLIDISDLSNPYQLTHFFDGGYAYDVKVIGNLAYVADRSDGLEIIQLYSEKEKTSESTLGFETLIPIIYLILVYFQKKKKERFPNC